MASVKGVFKTGLGIDYTEEEEPLEEVSPK